MEFKNMGLRGIYGPNKDEIIGGWGKLNNEELHNLYFTPILNRMIKSRRMRWSGHVARRGEKMNAYSNLVGKPEETAWKTDIGGQVILK
jgi:hypothetical protein